MSDENIFNKPNVMFAFVSAIALAALPYFNAPAWAWLLIFAWLLIWLFVLLAQSHVKAHPRMIGALRDPAFKQLYTAVAGPLIARLWHWFCDPAPKGTGANGTSTGT